MAKFDANPDQPSATPSFPTKERFKLLLGSLPKILVSDVTRLRQILHD